jgi:hypothetical protein
MFVFHALRICLMNFGMNSRHLRRVAGKSMPTPQCIEMLFFVSLCSIYRMYYVQYVCIHIAILMPVLNVFSFCITIFIQRFPQAPPACSKHFQRPQETHCKYRLWSPGCSALYKVLPILYTNYIYLSSYIYRLCVNPKDFWFRKGMCYISPIHCLIR